MSNMLQFIDDFVKGNKELVVYGSYDTVDTAFKALVTDSVPKGYTGLIVGVAFTNNVNAEFDVRVEGKSVLKNPIHVMSLPSNMELEHLMIKVEGGRKFELLARGIAGSVSLAYRMVLLLIRG